MRKEWMMLTVGCLLLAGCAGARPFELDASYYQDSAPIVNDNQNAVAISAVSLSYRRLLERNHLPL